MVTRDECYPKVKVEIKVLLSSSSSNQQIVWRQVRRICIMMIMLRLKGLRNLLLIFNFCIGMCNNYQ